MKTFSEYRNALKSSFIKESASPQYTLFPKDKEELKHMINDEIKKHGDNANLNHIDVSNITDFSNLFTESFDGDISDWDVSNATNMSYMFAKCESFDCDISGWDVSKVTDMNYMFYEAGSFNQNISKWDVSNVKSYYDAFKDCPCPKEYRPKFKRRRL